MNQVTRKPKPWALQKIFFDVIIFDINGTETSRRATFICKNCRHICVWEEDSDAYRCTLCGRKLSPFGAHEIVKRYEEQLGNLKNEILLRSMRRNKNVKRRGNNNSESFQSAGV